MTHQAESLCFENTPVRFINNSANMKRNRLILSGCCLFSFALSAQDLQPFSDNNGQIPPASAYNGSLFKLSHQYPADSPVPPMPWRAAINNGQITTQNAGAYAQALKDAVGKDMSVLLSDYANWDAAKQGWYNEPWLGPDREAIHGMYIGNSSLEASLFKASGLKKPITTYVLTYYDKTAAQTLNRIWGTTALQPSITSASTQFPEGSLVVKAAFITAGPDVWPVMDGSQIWPLYITTDATTGDSAEPKVVNCYLMQLDIIVKDSVSAPKTGWVFSTLVYDNRVKPGAGGVWDQMVPLGAQWGNDPQASDPAILNPVLLENWNNPAAPAYGGETFGWGQRLSGPNDGAMNDIAFQADGKEWLVKNGKNSSCMSCHSSAQWNLTNPSVGMESFLMPSLTNPPGGAGPDGSYMESPVPGSPQWMVWFQNRLGNVPMNPGSIAGDFDMVLTFKTLPAWYTATTKNRHLLGSFDRRGKPRQIQYNGKGTK